MFPARYSIPRPFLPSLSAGIIIILPQAVPGALSFPPQATGEWVYRAIVAGEIVAAAVLRWFGNQMAAEHRINQPLRRHPFSFNEAFIKRAAVKRFIAFQDCGCQRGIIPHGEMQVEAIFSFAFNTHSS